MKAIYDSAVTQHKTSTIYLQHRRNTLQQAPLQDAIFHAPDKSKAKSTGQSTLWLWVLSFNTDRVYKGCRGDIVVIYHLK